MRKYDGYFSTLSCVRSRFQCCLRAATTEKKEENKGIRTYSELDITEVDGGRIEHEKNSSQLSLTSSHISINTPTRKLILLYLYIDRKG